MKEQLKDKYQITNVIKGITEKGANYFEIEAIDLSSGEIAKCTYFGNTTPKRLIAIQEVETKEGKIYQMAVIQPHTSRDKKTGRFITGARRTF